MNSLIQVLWLIVAITPTTAELVKVSTEKAVTVKCHQSVNLHCNITSHGGLSVKHLSWFHKNGHQICEVNETWDNNKHLNEECNYTTNTQLTLTLRQVQPLDCGKYTCKLRSNRGVKESTSIVNLQESPCYKDAESRSNDEGPTCIFTGVYPDGDVHWFQGDTKVSGNATNNTKQVEARGALTVTSYLKWERVKEVYKCSLWIPSTGEYLASIEDIKLDVLTVQKYKLNDGRSGSETFGPVCNLLGCLFLFYYTLFLE